MADRKTTRREARQPARPATAKTPRPIVLSAGWAAVVLGLLTILFFHELMIGGKTFVSPDTTQPAGFVRMGEQSLYKEHIYPLWNPFVFLGMPSFASGAYNPLIYPPDWPLALLNKVVPLPDMTWMILYYFLGAWFMFLLARELGARPEGALLAGAAFVFAPNLVAVGSGGHGSQLVDSAYLPLMLWLAVRWLRRGGPHHLAWLALAGGFQLLRGHVQICFYTWLAIVLYVAVEWLAALAKRRPDLMLLTGRAAAIAAAAGVAFGLAGFYNLPLQDYARWSIRGSAEGGGVGWNYATSWSLAPYELPAALVPWWAGFGRETYWGGMPFTDYPNVYLGVVAVLLAVPAFLANGAPRIFALVLALLSLLIAMGRHFPLYGLLYDHLPLFNKFRVPVMILVLFQLAAALGTAWGWSAILPGGDSKAEELRVRARRVGKLLVVLAGLLALALVVGVMGQGAWRDSYIALVRSHRSGVMLGASQGPEAYSAAMAGFVWQKFVSSLGRACLLGLLTIAVAWFARRGRIPALLATAGVLALLLGELWPVSGQVMGRFVGDVTQRNLEAGRDDIVDFLEKEGPPGHFRILPDESQSNRFAGFGIASLGGYHAAKPRLVQDLFDRKLNANFEWLRLLNVAYIVQHGEFEMTPPGLRLVYKGSANVYANLATLPRATLVGSYAVVQPAKAILDSVSTGMRDMAHFTYLEQDPRLQLGPVAGGRARIVSYRLNDVTLEVDTPGPALVRLADEWYPDWSARVDDRRTPVLRADYLLRAVYVPAGHHRVVFRYESAAVRRGLLVSLLSLVLVLAGFAASWWTGRRGPVPAGQAGPSATGEEAA
jgi:hypothetical protein